jgi:hypothetical protein
VSEYGFSQFDEDELLGEALRIDKYRFVEYLVGLDVVNISNVEGLLTKSVSEGNDDVTRLLLRLPVINELPENPRFETLMLIASSRLDKHIMRCLLEAKATIGSVTQDSIYWYFGAPSAAVLNLIEGEYADAVVDVLVERQMKKSQCDAKELMGNADRWLRPHYVRSMFR